MVVLVALLGLNYFTSTLAENTLLFACIFGSLAASFLLTASLRPEAIGRLFNYLVLVGCFSASWGIAEFLVTLGRANGPIIDPNTWAAMCNLLVIGVVAQSYRCGRISPLRCVALYLLAMAVAVSYSRLGAFILFAALGYALALGALRPELRRCAAIAVVCVIAAFGSVEAILAVNETEVRERTSVGFEESGWRERGYMWRAGLRVAADHPLGTGLGTFRAHYPLYRDTREYRTIGNYVHNDYIQIAAEGGWALGLLLIGLVLFLSLRLCIGTVIYLRKKDVVSLVPLCLVVAMGTVFAHALMNFPLYQLPNLILVGVLLAALARLTGGIQPRPLPEIRPLVMRGAAVAAVLMILVTLWADVLTERIVMRNEGSVARFFQASEARYFDTVRALRILRPGNSTNHFALATLYRRSADRIEDPEGARVLAAAAAQEYASGLDRNPFHFAVAGYLADLLGQYPGLEAEMTLQAPIEIRRAAADRARTSLRAHLLYARHLPIADQYNYLVEQAMPWLDLRAELTRDDRLKIIRSVGRGAVVRQETAVLERLLASLVEEARYHGWKSAERARRSTQCVGTWRAVLGC